MLIYNNFPDSPGYLCSKCGEKETNITYKTVSSTWKQLNVPDIHVSTLKKKKSLF